MHRKFLFLTLLAIAPLGRLTGAEAASPAALTQIIEGAQKEGTVNVMLRSGFNQRSMDRLRKEIREKFRVDLDIKFSPTGSMPKQLSDAIMEYKLGAPPTYDLMNFSSHIVEGNAAGVFERVDWRPLLLEGTNPEVVMDLPETKGAIVYFNGHQGMIYSVYLKMAQDKGMPAAWQSIEFSEVQNFSLSVRKGAKHPNAAKLVALYLASPQGAKFTLEESLAGNMYYPGNYEHDIAMQDKKQGIREAFPEKDPKIIKFVLSEESDRLEKEIKLILAGAAKR